MKEHPCFNGGGRTSGEDEIGLELGGRVRWGGWLSKPVWFRWRWVLQETWLPSTGGDPEDPRVTAMPADWTLYRLFVSSISAIQTLLFPP